MAFNFKNSQVKKEKFTRIGTSKPRGQNFNFKFRPAVSNAGRAAAEAKGDTFIAKVTHEFKLSNKLMEQLDIQNHSVAILIDANKDGVAQGVALAVTPEGHDLANTYVSKGEEYKKSAGFTHDSLMKALGECGILEVVEINADGSPADDEDPLLEVNQFLDLELVAEVASITEGDDDYMEEVEEGTGIPIYEVVKGEEVELASDEEPEEEEEEEMEVEA